MKAKVSKLIARRRRRKFSGFLVPYAKEIEDFGGRPTRYGARALPGMPAASKRDARRRSAVSTRLRSCPNRRHLGGCCGAAAGGAATGRQIRRSGHPSAIHRERNIACARDGGELGRRWWAENASRYGRAGPRRAPRRNRALRTNRRNRRPDSPSPNTTRGPPPPVSQSENSDCNTTVSHNRKRRECCATEEIIFITYA